jgi:hypothetical protein
MSEWRPISEITKRHQGLVILFCPGDDTRGAVTAGYWTEHGWFGWHDDYLDYQPSHWMLLPEPPENSVD